MAICDKLREIIPEGKIKINEPMRDHTSFRIGGPAEVMVLPTDIQEIREVVMLCKQTNTPLMVMGNGTNLLVSDRGISGVVVKLAQNFNDVDIQGDVMTCRAGVSLSTAAKAALDKNLKGLEFAHGIPGSVGGAAVMNAGAFEGDMAKIVEKVTVLDLNGGIYDMARDDIGYAYRQSIFQEGGKILLEVQMKLERGNHDEIKHKMEDYLARRLKKQPLNMPSAGSAFKRPVGNYAGHLIEQSGLKGFKIGEAMVSDLHAGFIVNTGNATFDDVVQLIHHIKKVVKEKFQVDLEPEIKIKGD